MQSAREHYHVPKYQREYTWGKWNWDLLLQDIDENDPGYFMGSLICIKDGEPLRFPEMKYFRSRRWPAATDDALAADDGDLRTVGRTSEDSQVRGQRRSRRLPEHARQPAQSTRQEEETRGVSERRVGRLGRAIEDVLSTRVQPSGQNSNLEDYKYLLGEIGLPKPRDKP